MEDAEWNEEDRTISVADPDEPRMGKTVANLDELVAYLEGIASTAFYANCASDDGEYRPRLAPAYETRALNCLS